jgi:3-oxoacyl-[acyl-carrier protein] reductase
VVVDIRWELPKILPRLIQKKWGRILHISTLSTKTNSGYPAYISSKYALEGYVKAVSQDLSSYNVILNAIAPGLLKIKERYYGKLEQEFPEKMAEYYKNYLSIGRMADCAEVATVATFLCSNFSSYMPGAIVSVDGGSR